MGISDANFAVAETGMISITENEGNARLSTSLPQNPYRIGGHREKSCRDPEDLALFSFPCSPPQARASNSPRLTTRSTAVPCQKGETDGPEQFHVVLLDNRRTELLADPEQRDALHCIRCGACLNVCPIFKNVGGHTYGTTYQGPIGSVITPHLRGLENWKHLSLPASSLCEAHARKPARSASICIITCFITAVMPWPGILTWWEKMLYAGFVFVMRRPALYRLAGKLGSAFFPLQKLVSGSRFDPLRNWTATRDFPAHLTEESFLKITGASERSPIMPLPDQREEVFGRIREALRQPAPHRHAAHLTEPIVEKDDGLPGADAFRTWLPQVGPSVEEQITLFAQNAAMLKAEFFQVAALEEASVHLAQIAREAGWKRIATHGHPLASALAARIESPYP